MTAHLAHSLAKVARSIDRAYSKNAGVTSLCVAKAGGFRYSLPLLLSRPIPSPD